MLAEAGCQSITNHLAMHNSEGRLVKGQWSVYICHRVRQSDVYIVYILITLSLYHN